MKAEEMTIAEYNEKMMDDAFEMLLKADRKIGEAEAMNNGDVLDFAHLEQTESLTVR